MPPLSSASGYTPGSSYTNTSGADFTPADYARALLMREATMPAAAPVPVGRRMAPVGMGASMPEVPVITRPGRQAPRAFETPWYSQQGAATRLTGVGAGMIPGLAVDQNLLPPDMRHQSSNFVPTGITAASALTPERSGPFDPYEGRRLEGPGVAMGPGADFARRQMANAAGRR